MRTSGSKSFIHLLKISHVDAPLVIVYMDKRNVFYCKAIIFLNASTQASQVYGYESKET